MLWAYTLFLPSFAGGLLLGAATIADGPWGIAALRPQGLLGLWSSDPLVHSLFWSLARNTLLFLCVSVLLRATPARAAAGRAVRRRLPDGGRRAAALSTGSATSEDLFVLAQRILGAEPARRLFDRMAREQGRAGRPAGADPAVIARLERELAGSVGAASAHAMVWRIAGGDSVGLTELIDIADETQRLIETLAPARREVGRTRARRPASSATPTRGCALLDAQKDEFLSQVSHELRTPMTSIRSFSEILLGAGRRARGRPRGASSPSSTRRASG